MCRLLVRWRGSRSGVTAERRREELGNALARRGARIVYGPAIRVVPLADDTELLAATRRCLAAPLDVVVATTGVGFRGWLDTAEAWGLKDDIVARAGGRHDPHPRPEGPRRGPCGGPA